MDDRDYDRKLDELDRLLNDPDRRMDPDKVWDILAEISRLTNLRHATPQMRAPADIPGSGFCDHPGPVNQSSICG